MTKKSKKMEKITVSIDRFALRQPDREDSISLYRDGQEFCFESGCLNYLKGPSGRGKSLLLKMLSAVLPEKPEFLELSAKVNWHFSGNCQYPVYDDKMAYKPAVKALRAVHFGFIFQDLLLLNDLSCQENLRLPLRLLGWQDIVSNGELFKQEWFKSLNIQDCMNKRVCDCSGGQQQRVAVARALVTDPDVIIADEPTSSLDAENARKINDIFVELIDKGKIIIIITHDDHQIFWGECKKKLYFIDDCIDAVVKPVPLNNTKGNSAFKGKPCPSCGKTDWEIGKVAGAGVFIDICNNCKGVWLDHGELEVIQYFPLHLLEEVRKIDKNLQTAAQSTQEIIKNGV